MAKKRIGIHDTETVTLVSKRGQRVYVKDMMYKNALELYRRRDGVKNTIYQKDFTSMKSNVESREELMKEFVIPPPPPAPKKEFVIPPPPK